MATAIKTTTTKNVVTQGTKTAAGVVNYNPNTGAKLKTGESVTVKSGGNTYGSNPVTSSSSTRADNNALGVDISGLKKAYSQSNAILAEEKARLAEERTATLGDIKTQSEIDQAAQKVSQGRDYAARSTSLITSGGGFLGATQSQEGVLQNLKGTFDAEHTALIAKRDAAINAANSAYNDKDFAVAREMANNAKDLQNEIYKRQTDYADMQIKMAQNNRAQTEFDVGMADKKVKAYAMMSDAEFNATDPNEIATVDASYYPGYTKNARLIEQKAQQVKTAKDAVDLDSNILDMRLKMPYGVKFNLGGQTYTGLKSADGGSAADKKDAAFNKISEILSGKLNTEGSQLYTIPGTKGVPYVDSGGFLTPEGWLYAVKNFGVPAKDLIDEYSHLFNPKGIDNYQLSEVQKNLIRPKL